MKIKPLIFFMVLTVFLLTGCSSFLTNEHTKDVTHGDVSFSEKELEADEVYPLNGEWAFYWKEFIESEKIHQDFQRGEVNTVEIPNPWINDTGERFGYGTYALHVKIPDAYVGSPLGLYIPYEATSYSLWINNKRYAVNGFVGSSRKTSEPEFRKEIVSFVPDSTDVEVVLYISNFEHYIGGFVSPIYFGTSKATSDFLFEKVAWNLFLTGSILMMGIYQISIYIFRRKEKSFLFFGLVSLFIAFRSLFVDPIFINDLFPNISWIWQSRFEYFVIYSAGISYLLFIRSLYPKEMNDYVTFGAIVVTAAVEVVTLFTPMYVYRALFNGYLAFGLLMILYIFYVMIIAAIHNRPTARLHVVVSMFFLLTVVNDALISLNWLSGPMLVTFGFFMYILFQSINLSRNYARNFHEAEQLSEQLQEVNQTLDEKIHERTLELRVMNEQLQQLTMLDGLTGVSNRRFFDDQLRELIDHARPFALLLIDLDEFKKYNDTYGHVAGDDLIKQAATMFSDVIGEEGVVSRYGGEEFAILLPLVSELRAREIAERIRNGLEQLAIPHRTNSAANVATLSIGGMSCQSRQLTQSECIQMADKALYAAKKNGRNQVVMYEDIKGELTND